MVKRESGLDHSRRTRGGLFVADLRFDRTQCAPARHPGTGALTVNLLKGADFGGVPRGRARPMGFDHLDGILFVNRIPVTARLGIRKALKELENKYKAELRAG